MIDFSKRLDWAKTPEKKTHLVEIYDTLDRVSDKRDSFETLPKKQS